MVNRYDCDKLLPLYYYELMQVAVRDNIGSSSDSSIDDREELKHAIELLTVNDGIDGPPSAYLLAEGGEGDTSSSSSGGMPTWLLPTIIVISILAVLAFAGGLYVRNERKKLKLEKERRRMAREESLVAKEERRKLKENKAKKAANGQRRQRGSNVLVESVDVLDDLAGALDDNKDDVNNAIVDQGPNKRSSVKSSMASAASDDSEINRLFSSATNGGGGSKPPVSPAPDTRSEDALAAILTVESLHAPSKRRIKKKAGARTTNYESDSNPSGAFDSSDQNGLDFSRHTDKDNARNVDEDDPVPVADLSRNSGPSRRGLGQLVSSFRKSTTTGGSDDKDQAASANARSVVKQKKAVKKKFGAKSSAATPTSGRPGLTSMASMRMSVRNVIIGELSSEEEESSSDSDSGYDEYSDSSFDKSANKPQDTKEEVSMAHKSRTQLVVENENKNPPPPPRRALPRTLSKLTASFRGGIDDKKSGGKTRSKRKVIKSNNSAKQPTRQATADKVPSVNNSQGAKPRRASLNDHHKGGKQHHVSRAMTAEKTKEEKQNGRTTVTNGSGKASTAGDNEEKQPVKLDGSERHSGKPNADLHESILSHTNYLPFSLDGPTGLKLQKSLDSSKRSLGSKQSSKESVDLEEESHRSRRKKPSKDSDLNASKESLRSHGKSSHKDSDFNASKESLRKGSKSSKSSDRKKSSRDRHGKKTSTTRRPTKEFKDHDHQQHSKQKKSNHKPRRPNLKDLKSSLTSSMSSLKKGKSLSNIAASALEEENVEEDVFDTTERQSNRDREKGRGRSGSGQKLRNISERSGSTLDRKSLESVRSERSTSKKTSKKSSSHYDGEKRKKKKPKSSSSSNKQHSSKKHKSSSSSRRDYSTSDGEVLVKKSKKKSEEG